jgi:hypothetical protein
VDQDTAASCAVAAQSRPDTAKDDWRAFPAAHVPVGAPPQRDGGECGTLPAEGQTSAAHVAAAVPGGPRVAQPEVPAQGVAGFPFLEAQVAVCDRWCRARPRSGRKADGAGRVRFHGVGGPRRYGVQAEGLAAALRSALSRSPAPPGLGAGVWKPPIAPESSREAARRAFL